MLLLKCQVVLTLQPKNSPVSSYVDVKQFCAAKILWTVLRMVLNQELSYM